MEEDGELGAKEFGVASSWMTRTVNVMLCQWYWLGVREHTLQTVLESQWRIGIGVKIKELAESLGVEAEVVELASYFLQDFLQLAVRNGRFYPVRGIVCESMSAQLDDQLCYAITVYLGATTRPGNRERTSC